MSTDDTAASEHGADAETTEVPPPPADEPGWPGQSMTTPTRCRLTGTVDSCGPVSLCLSSP